MQLIRNNWRFCSMLLLLGVGAGLFAIAQPIVEGKYRRWLTDEMQKEIRETAAGVAIETKVAGNKKVFIGDMTPQQIEIALTVSINKLAQCENKIEDLKLIVN